MAKRDASFMAAARAAVLETTSPADYAPLSRMHSETSAIPSWSRGQTRVTPDSSPASGRTAVQLSLRSPGLNDSAIGASYDYAIQDALNAVAGLSTGATHNDSDNSALHPSSIDMQFEGRNKSVNPVSRAASGAPSPGLYDSPAPIGRSLASHPSAGAGLAASLAASLADTRTALRVALEGARARAEECSYLQEQAREGAGGGRVEGRSPQRSPDSAYAGSGMGLNLSGSMRDTVPSGVTHLNPISSWRGRGRQSQSPLTNTWASPAPAPLVPAFDRTMPVPGVPIFNPRDPQAAVRAAEALYLAHAAWRRAHAMAEYPPFPQPAGTASDNPYLHAEYAFARAGWTGKGPPSPSPSQAAPSASTHTLVTDALHRVIGSDGGGGGSPRAMSRAGPSHPFSTRMPTSYSSNGSGPVFDALCTRLGVDPLEPGAVGRIVAVAGHLERAALVAAGLDSFASGVCTSVRTHLLGLPGGEAGGRMGLTQAAATLDAALGELAQLRRDKYRYSVGLGGSGRMGAA